MKKYNILAAIIPTLLASHAINAIELYNSNGNKFEIYGKTSGIRYLTHPEYKHSDRSDVHLGFKGESKINEDMTAYGQWEYNFQTNNSEGFDSQEGNSTRLAFAGIKFDDNNSFDYGRNYGVIYDALSWTDVLPEFGGKLAYADNFMTGRSTSMATYRNSNFFGLVEGLNIALQYQFKNVRNDIQHTNGHGFGISSSYTFQNGIGVVTAYSAAGHTQEQNEKNILGHAEFARQWSSAIKYDMNNFYLAAMYGQTYNTTPISINVKDAEFNGFAKKTQYFEMVAQYQFDFGLRPSIAYSVSRAKDVEHLGKAMIQKYIDIGASFYFNKNISSYIDYRINQLAPHNPFNFNTNDTIALGLVYQF